MVLLESATDIVQRMDTRNSQEEDKMIAVNAITKESHRKAQGMRKVFERKISKASLRSHFQ